MRIGEASYIFTAILSPIHKKNLYFVNTIAFFTQRKYNNAGAFDSNIFV